MGAKVEFERGAERNLPTEGMAEDGHIYVSSDNGNVYVGVRNALVPVNRSPYYATCPTAAETSVKVATVDDTEHFSLKTGVMVTVKFSNVNSGRSVQLNVNGTGAKDMRLHEPWEAGDCVTFVYDGTRWVATTGSSVRYTAGEGVAINASNVVSAVVDSGNANGLSVGRDGLALSTATTSSAGAMSAGDKAKLDAVEDGAQANVQPDWAQADSSADDFIKNKPTIPAVGTLNTNNATSQSVPSNPESFGGNIKLHKVSKTGSFNDLLDTENVIQDRDLISLSAFVSKHKLFIAPINDVLYAADERFVVTHKVYDTSTGDYLRDLSTNLFRMNYDQYSNRVNAGETGTLYIGATDEESIEESSSYMFTYPQGKVYLNFYSSAGPSDPSGITVRLLFRNNGWREVEAVRYGSSNRIFYFSVPTGNYLQAIEVTYVNENANYFSLSAVEKDATHTSISQMPVLTKYGINQRMYGNLTAPKFITVGGSSSQFVKGDGSLDGTEYLQPDDPRLYDGKEIAGELDTTYAVRRHYINSAGGWVSSSTYGHYAIPVDGVRMIRMKADTDNSMLFVFVKNYVFGSPPTSDLAEGYWGRKVYGKNSEVELTVPRDAEHLIVYAGSISTKPNKPQSIKLYGTLVTRTHQDDAYYGRMEPLTAEEAVISGWRNHDVKDLVLASHIRNGYIRSSDDVYKSSTTYYCSLVPMSKHVKSVRVVAPQNVSAIIAFLALDVQTNVVATYAGDTQRIVVPAGQEETFDVPEGTLLMYVSLGLLSDDVYTYMPEGLYFTGDRGGENFALTIGSQTYDGSQPVSITGIPSPADNAPLMDGTASVGTSADYAREDHVHPTDTSRAADAYVVHKTGVETISGAKTFQGGLMIGPSRSIDFLPDQDQNEVAMHLYDSESGVAVLTLEDADGGNGVKVRGVATPTTNFDAVNKAYVDDIVGDIETLLNSI